MLVASGASPWIANVPVRMSPRRGRLKHVYPIHPPRQSPPAGARIFQPITYHGLAPEATTKRRYAANGNGTPHSASVGDGLGSLAAARQTCLYPAHGGKSRYDVLDRPPGSPLAPVARWVATGPVARWVVAWIRRGGSARLVSPTLLPTSPCSREPNEYHRPELGRTTRKPGLKK